ncbi:hypothetical protein MUK70_15195 [Dyadobacter chenwenxiniae]|uniref:Uncharacterized protein n=1 Tax=Dyadobacter chenwenxiniae TaxID=2906456 RepID=A0A9X1PJE1_9BACT|nr:hypothetical protein [Dyadobacter chenwenxiniae]MCF0051612.1 hypothetical protein [Dyadobacter chenwenxiniae]MCF0060588.1 hypothetical protein [Dyadobacter chenwenxiniae]UON86319.1 hypothetical protein MUK70_15195 [Dyadobacter chenwenxiniae]
MKKKKSYFWPIVLLVVVFSLMSDFLARISSAFFLPVDRLLFISPSISPVTMWAFLGMLLGVVYGSFVAIKKFRLDSKLIVIPVGIAIVMINLMILLS